MATSPHELPAYSGDHPVAESHEPPVPEPEPWPSFWDRLLWGANAPNTPDTRAKRWAKFNRDVQEILRAFG